MKGCRSRGQNQADAIRWIQYPSTWNIFTYKNCRRSISIVCWTACSIQVKYHLCKDPTVFWLYTGSLWTRTFTTISVWVPWLLFNQWLSVFLVQWLTYFSRVSSLPFLMSGADSGSDRSLFKWDPSSLSFGLSPALVLGCCAIANAPTKPEEEMSLVRALCCGKNGLSSSAWYLLMQCHSKTKSFGIVIV